jgi:hypothetical protein
VLEREAERLVGADARWLGWWSDRVDLVRSETGPEKVVVDVLPLDPSALDALAMALPHVRAEDLQVAGDDRAVARRLALWRAARGPLVDDERLAAAVERDLVPSLIEDVAQRPDFDRQAASTSDELLWPLSRMLLGDALLERLCGEPDGGARWSLAVAPPPLLGRIPWAALPLKDPSERDCVPTLVERADLVVAVPASLSAAMARNASGVRSGATMLVLDPREDLLFARAIQLEGARILRGRAEATRDAVLAALKAKPAIAAFAAHVRAGGDDDPAASAILLADSAGGTAPLGVGDLAKIQAPPVCVLLVCDGAGAATGAEWTGVATGLLWAGAGWVVTTTAAVIDDRLSPELDSELLLAIAELGPLDGLWSWQRRCAQRRRDDTDPRYAPYRWANFVALACGSRDSAVATG